MEKAGLKLFLRYAWPCSEEKLKSGQIDQSRFNILKLLAENGDAPPIILLEKVYPGAVDRYREFCASKDYEANFDLESVKKYWRENHTNRDYCSVIKAEVCLSESDGTTLVICDNRPINVSNPYKLALKFREFVFIHRKIVVEKVD